ncbi:MAG: hypothetical protein IT487_02080 [Chromatiaceae bacterium]|nr:hypothetical protein [Chromatiaceae bacterium]
MAEMTVEMRRFQWVIWSEHGPATVAERGLLQCLFDYLATSGRIYPAASTLAVKTGLNERTVRAHLDNLCRHNWLSRRTRGTPSGQGWRRYEYKLHWPAHLSAVRDEYLKATEAERLRARDDYRREHDWQTGGDVDDDDDTAPPTPEPPPRDALPPGYQVDPEVWATLANWRRAIGSPMSLQAAKMAASALESYPTPDQWIVVEDAHRQGNLRLPAGTQRLEIDDSLRRQAAEWRAQRLGRAAPPATQPPATATRFDPRQPPYPDLDRTAWRRLSQYWEHTGYPVTHADALRVADHLRVVADQVATVDAMIARGQPMPR